MFVKGTHTLEQIYFNTLAQGEQLREKQGYLLAIVASANYADDAQIMQNWMWVRPWKLCLGF